MTVVEVKFEGHPSVEEKAKRRLSLAVSNADDVRQFSAQRRFSMTVNPKLLEASRTNFQLDQISEAKGLLAAAAEPAKASLADILKKVKVLLEKDLHRTTKIKLLRCTKQIIKNSSFERLEQNLMGIQEVYDVTLKNKNLERFARSLGKKLNEIHAQELLNFIIVQRDCKVGLQIGKLIVLCHNEFTTTFAFLQRIEGLLKIFKDDPVPNTSIIILKMAKYLLKISSKESFSVKELTMFKGIVNHASLYNNEEILKVKDKIWAMLRSSLPKPAFIIMEDTTDPESEIVFKHALNCTKPDDLKKLIKKEGVKFYAFLNMDSKEALKYYHSFFNILQNHIVEKLIANAPEKAPKEVIKFWVSLAKQFVGDPYILTVFHAAFNNPAVVKAKVDFSCVKKEMDEISSTVSCATSYASKKKKNFCEDGAHLLLVAYVIARDIRTTNIELFYNVTLKDLSDLKSSDTVFKIATLYNSLSSFIISEILEGETETHRANNIKFWIYVLTAVDLMQDLQGGVSIFSSLEYTPVSRLKHSWKLLEQKHPQAKVLFGIHSKTYDAGGTHRNLKARAQKALRESQFIIPYFGILKSQMALGGEAYPRRIAVNSKTESQAPLVPVTQINLERINICGKIYQDLVNYQAKGLREERILSDFISRLPSVSVLDETKFEAISYKIEASPRHT